MRDRDEHRTEDRAVAWYETLRNRYRPAEIQVLLVAESPPDPRAGERRFFYSPQLSYDNLYRGVATALYGTDLNFNLEDKPAVLERIKNDGIWLIDAVETLSIRYRSSSGRRRSRRAHLRSSESAETSTRSVE